MDERLRGISFDDFQQTKDNAYNLKLCLRYAKHFDEMLAKNQGLLFYGGSEPARRSQRPALQTIS